MYLKALECIHVHCCALNPSESGAFDQLIRHHCAPLRVSLSGTSVTIEWAVGK